MVLPQLRCAELCAKLFWGDVALSAPAYPGDPQLGAVPAAAGMPGQAALVVLRKFKEVLASHRVLIKYTGIVAAVAAPQILSQVREWCSAEPPGVLGSRGSSRWVPADLPCLARAGLGCDEEGLRETLQVQFVLWLNRRSHSGRSSLVRGGRKPRLEEMR